MQINSWMTRRGHAPQFAGDNVFHRRSWGLRFARLTRLALFALLVAAGATAPVSAQVYQLNYITNGTFETVTLTNGQVLPYGSTAQPVNGWTYTGRAGIAREDPTKMTGLPHPYNPPYNNGNYAYAFAGGETPAKLEHVFYLPQRGGYTLRCVAEGAGSFVNTNLPSFYLFARMSVLNSRGELLATVTKDVLNSYPDWSLPFTTQDPGAHTVRFDNLVNSLGTNNALLVDDVVVARTEFTSLTNGNFDLNPLNAGQFRYLATNSQPVDGWAFQGSAGVATDSSNKTGFATSVTGRYDGTNYVFLQSGAGSATAVEQSVLLPVTGQWLLSFNFAGRRAGGNFGGNASFRATVYDSALNVLATTQYVATSGLTFTNRTLPFTAYNRGPFTLRFHDVQNITGADNTVFLDDVKLLVPAQYALFMVPNSFIDIVNTTPSRWYFFSAPTPAPARMSRVNSAGTSETPWGGNGFAPDGSFVQNRIFQGEMLRVYSETVPTNGFIRVESSFTPLGERFSFDIRVGASPFVRAIEKLDPSPTVADTVRWRVVLSHETEGVSHYNFALVSPTGISGAAITSVTGQGSNWTVTASTGTGLGLLGLNWIATADERPNVPVKFTGQVYDFSPMPLFTDEPDTTNVSVGFAVTLRANAVLRGTGAPTYQWYEGTSQFPNAAVLLSGATNSTFTLPATTNAYSRNFFVRAFNGPGYTRDSVTATVRALFEPVIVTQPADQIIDSGSPATLTVAVTGGQPMTYEWYRGAAGDVSRPVAGGATLVTPALVTNAQFWVRVSNPLGIASAATSRVANVYLTTRITAQPASVSLCAGQPVTFNVAFSSVELNPPVRWQRRRGTEPFADLTDATNRSLTLPAVTLDDDGTWFRAIISPSGTNMITREAAISVPTVLNPTVSYTFNGPVPTNTAVYGRAISAGELVLTPPFPGQAGAWLTADLAPGQAVRGFAAKFNVAIRPAVGSQLPADGLSFNWASDLPNGTYAAAEEGQGNGLRVCFDIYDNGGGEGPAIDVKWGNQLIAHYPTSIGFLLGSSAANANEANVRLHPDGTVDVTYRCVSICSRVPIPQYTPLFNSRFGFGGRTGASFASHAIDNFEASLDVDPTLGIPTFTAWEYAPLSGVTFRGTGTAGATYPLFATEDFLTWHYRANVTVEANGAFEFLEPEITTPAHQFYRLHAAPHLPLSLSSWWRAEGQALDSYGNRSASVDASPSAPGFKPGFRGSSFAFAGTNALHLGQPPLSPPWTLSFWVNSQIAPGTTATVLADGAHRFHLDASGSTNAIPTFSDGAQTLIFTNAPIATNRWAHLALIHSGTAISAFVDGAAAGSLAATAPLALPLPLQILGAADLEATINPLLGQLDEILLFDRALTIEEIRAVLNATRGP